jgi:tRNA(fMet)-specific endonuclease VapC
VSGKYLLDANSAIDVLNGKLDLDARQGDGDEIYLSANVVGELYFGAEKSGRPEANRAAIQSLSARFPVLPCTEDTAGHYARVRNRLRLRGKPIPENDLWIAATAFEHDLELVTRDGHFEQIEDLRRVAW